MNTLKRLLLFILIFLSQVVSAQQYQEYDFAASWSGNLAGLNFVNTSANASIDKPDAALDIIRIPSNSNTTIKVKIKWNPDYLGTVVITAGFTLNAACCAGVPPNNTVPPDCPCWSETKTKSVTFACPTSFGIIPLTQYQQTLPMLNSVSIVNPYPNNIVKWYIKGPNDPDFVYHAGPSLNAVDFVAYNPGITQYYCTQTFSPCGTISSNIVSFEGVSSCALSQDIPYIRANSKINSPAIELGLGYASESGGYKINKNQDYSITLNGISGNWWDNYILTSNGSATDVVFSNLNTTSPTFQVKTDVGQYAIQFVKKTQNGMDNCPTIPPFNVLVGADQSNYSFKENCFIVLPDYLMNKYHVTTTDGLNLLLKNFTWTVESSVGIQAKPGIVLKIGAHLKLNVQDESTTTDDPTHLWTESTGYDEEGSVISQGRQYFDKLSRPTQSQIKVISSGIALGQQTLYDVHGRAAISTLSAPITEASVTTQKDACGNEVKAWEAIPFKYNPSFVLNDQNSPYSYTDFDQANLNTPVQLGTGAAGTLNLGRYYSASGSEDYVATSHYPYSRTYWYEDGSDFAKGSTLPGDVHRMGLGHIAESDIVAVPLAITSDAGTILVNEYINYGAALSAITLNNVYKTVSTDIDQHISETYFDGDGNAIIFKNVLGQVSYSYYNTVGQLVCGVTPNGVTQLRSGTAFSDIDKTTYVYDVNGRLETTTSKDGGSTNYIYSIDETLRFSQNIRQAALAAKPFSYTNYDEVGRVIEFGEFYPDLTVTAPLLFNSAILKNLTEQDVTNSDLSTGGTKKDKVNISYDEQAGDSPISQDFTIGRIATTERDNGSKTWYHYDEQGRLIKLAIRINIAETPVIKTVDYLYNTVGNVREIAYQKGNSFDEFYHYYQYDADSRLSKVYAGKTAPTYATIGTTVQPIVNVGDITNISDLALHAVYTYYKHGALKRLELGNGLQGIDYVYTIQGWLKAINHPVASKDPGGDSNDSFGMTLEYFDGDYTHTGSGITNINPGSNYVNSFAGLTRAISWKINAHPNVTSPDNRSGAYAYNYDVSGQMKSAIFGDVDFTQNAFTADALNKYNENVGSYDPNGNIQSLGRKNQYGSLAAYSYSYVANTNKLSSVLQANLDEQNQPILNQGQPTYTTYGTYSYDEAGRLTNMAKLVNGTSKTFSMQYDVTSKNTEVKEDGILVTKNIYDEGGYLVADEQYNKTTGNLNLKNYYVRDAQGTLLSMYIQQYANNSPSGGLQQREIPVYGDKRIGILAGRGTAWESYYYSIYDHQGSVRTQVSRKSALLSIDSWINYFPYGLEMDGWVSTSSGTPDRQGFQGENADRPKDKTGFNTFQLRMYDPVIGRWTSVDPKGQFNSPYVGMGNNPVTGTDPDGGYSYLGAFWRNGFSTKNLVTFGDHVWGINRGVSGTESFTMGADGVVTLGAVGPTHDYGRKGSRSTPFIKFYKKPSYGLNVDYAMAHKPVDPNWVIKEKPRAPGTIEIDNTLESVAIPIGVASWVGRIGRAALAAEAGSEVIAAEGGQTIVGEGMKRVSMEAAKREGSVILNTMPEFTGTADQITSQMMTYNRQWILQQMRSGRPILDIGLDPNRGVPSIFYQMEQNMMKNYLKLHPGAF